MAAPAPPARSSTGRWAVTGMSAVLTGASFLFCVLDVLASPPSPPLPPPPLSLLPPVGVAFVVLSAFRLDYSVGAWKIQAAKEGAERKRTEAERLRNPRRYRCSACGSDKMWVANDDSAVCMNCMTGVTHGSSPPPPPPTGVPRMALAGDAAAKVVVLKMESKRRLFWGLGTGVCFLVVGVFGIFSAATGRVGAVLSPVLGTAIVDVLIMLVALVAGLKLGYHAVTGREPGAPKGNLAALACEAGGEVRAPGASAHPVRDPSPGGGPPAGLRPRAPRRPPLHARNPPDHAPRSPLDHAPVRRVRKRRGVEPPLPLSPFDGEHGALRRLRPPDPDGL